MADWFRLRRLDGTLALVAADPGATIKSRYITRFRTAFNVANNNVLTQVLNAKTSDLTSAQIRTAVTRAGSTTASSDWTNPTIADCGYALKLMAEVAERERGSTWEVL